MRYLPHPSKCISCRIAYPGVDVVPNANWNFCSPYLAALSAVLLATTQPATANSRRTDAQQNGRLLTLLVSLKKQRLEVYDQDGLVATAPISSGTRSNPTPTGIFSVLQKNRTHFSNLYDSAPMPNMQRITWSGVALHAGALPGFPASHGCIRLPYAFSRTLFSMTSLGTRVIVTHDPVEGPRAFTHARLPEALPPGEPVVATAADVTSSGASVKSAATGLATVSAALGVTPAVAAEAAARQVALSPVRTGAGGGTTRTRSVARAERQADIAARTAEIEAAEAARVAAAAAVATANATLLSAKSSLRDARLELVKLEQEQRTITSRRNQLEQGLADFIKRQRQAMRLAEIKTRQRQAEHLADAASDRPTEQLLRRAEQRQADAQRDIDNAELAASKEAELENAIAGADQDLRDTEAATAAQRQTVARLEPPVTQAEAALPAVRTHFATAQNRIDAAKGAHARAVSALAQYDKPATVFVSRKTGLLYVRQGFEDVFQAPVAIRMPEAPIGTHVFNAVRYADDSETRLDWRAVTVATGDGNAGEAKPAGRTRAASMDDEPAISRLAKAPTAANALERIEMAAEVRARLSEIVKPGSTLIVSDAGISNETGKFTDIIVQPR